MKFVIQRVTSASVEVEEKIVGVEIICNFAPKEIENIKKQCKM